MRHVWSGRVDPQLARLHGSLGLAGGTSAVPKAGAGGI
jgi:hypothetical protein